MTKRGFRFVYREHSPVIAARSTRNGRIIIRRRYVGVGHVSTRSVMSERL